MLIYGVETRAILGVPAQVTSPARTVIKPYLEAIVK